MIQQKHPGYYTILPGLSKGDAMGSSEPGQLDFKRKLLDEAKGGILATYLMVLPASGTVHRIKGVLLSVDLGGDAKYSLFLVDAASRAIMAIDPRALIVDERTLIAVYHPRNHIDNIQAAAVEWFQLNPNVFCPNVKSGITPI